VHAGDAQVGVAGLELGALRAEAAVAEALEEVEKVPPKLPVTMSRSPSASMSIAAGLVQIFSTMCSSVAGMMRGSSSVPLRSTAGSKSPPARP
jgi:hypothetical protein